MALATLSIDLEARLAKFEQGLDKAARLAEKNAERQRAAWNRLGANVAGVAGAISGAFAGISAIGFLRKQADELDAFNDAADATGASVENLSALEEVGKRVGTEFDTITSILVKFNAVLADAKPGSPQEQALKAIGLSAAELRKIDPAEALRRTAQALAGYADDGNKARLVQDLFGKSVREAAPFLKDLAEAGQLNAKVTAQQAAEAEKFNKLLFAFQADSAAAGRAIASELLPSVSKLLQELRTGAEVFGGFWAAAKGVGLSNPSMGISDRVDQIAALRARLSELEAEAANPPLLFNRQANAARQDKVKEDIAQLERVLEYQKRIQALNVPQADYSNEGSLGRNSGLKSVGELPGIDKKKQGIDEAAQSLARYVEQLQREIDKGQELTEQQKALNLLRELGVTGEIPQVRELVLGLADKVKALKDEEELQKAITAELERQAAVQKSLDDALEAFSGRTADALKRAQTQRLEARIAAGEVFSKEELERIVNGIAGLGDRSHEVFDEMGEFAKQAARNIQDSLGETVRLSLSNDFDGILSLWSNMLVRMASEAAGAQIGKYLLGDFDKTGAVGGVLGGLFGGKSLAGGQYGSIFDLFSGSFGGGFFAAGGDHEGGWRVVGERGPELEATGPARIFSAQQTREILRGNAGGGRAAGGDTFHFSFPIQAGVSRAELAQLIPTITEQCKAAVALAQRRPGNALSR